MAMKETQKDGRPAGRSRSRDAGARRARGGGITPRVSLHIPWDKVDDYDRLRRHAEERGIGIGTVNSNVFQDEDYKLGSLCNPDETIRAKAIAHHLECIDIMRAVDAPALKIWLADGTNYPGQDSIHERQDRLADSLAQIYAALNSDQRLVLEYKFFEPAFYLFGRY